MKIVYYNVTLYAGPNKYGSVRAKFKQYKDGRLVLAEEIRFHEATSQVEVTHGKVAGRIFALHRTVDVGMQPYFTPSCIDTDGV
jgi:hypothetical protein